MRTLLVCVLIGLASPAWADNCDVAQGNLVAMQTRAVNAIETARLHPRSPSPRKLAVLEASRAQGYYTAMQSMLPLACKGERFTDLDQKLAVEIPKMQAYVQQNW